VIERPAFEKIERDGHRDASGRSCPAVG